MRPLLPVVLKDPAAWFLAALTAVAAVGAVASRGASVEASVNTSLGWTWVASTLGGGVLAASVWGSVTSAAAEESAHLAGTPARTLRVRLFALLVLVATAPAVAISAAVAATTLVSPGQSTSALRASDLILFGSCGATSVALATVLAWSRPRVLALGLTVPAVAVPVLVYFGPRLSGREVVLAISPTTGPTVIAPAARSAAATVVLAVIVVASVWGACAAVLASPAVARSVGARSVWGSRPRSSSVRGWGRVVVWGAATAVVIGVLPTFGERIPYQWRYATVTQNARGTAPTDVVALFLQRSAEGRVSSAGRLAVAGDAARVLDGLPASFAARVQASPLAVMSSSSVRTAEVEIVARGRAFYACLVHPQREWLIERIQGTRCG